MRCPKCGFNQPDDPYCANCGVRVSSYRMRRHRALYVAVLISTLLVGALWGGRNFFAPVVPRPNADYTMATEERRSSRSGKISPGSGISQRQTSAGPSPQARGLKRAESRGQVGVGADQGTGAESFEEHNGQQLLGQRSATAPRTALAWFLRGRGRSDDSELEAECYRKALEIDPGFAAAYYFLAAVEFRRGDLEMAAALFEEFVLNATASELQSYDLTSYLSQDTIERMLEKRRARVVERAVDETPNNGAGVSRTEGDQYQE